MQGVAGRVAGEKVVEGGPAGARTEAGEVHGAGGALLVKLRESRPCGAAMYTIASFVNMMRHKHLKLDQTKIERAKKLLGVKTEQEAIERALDLVLAEAAIVKALRQVKGVGGFEQPIR
jgi:hypothetical protein